MRSIFSFILITSFTQIVHAAPDATICFFSLNNEKEFIVARTFSDRLASKTGKKVEILEFQNPDKEINPQKSFQRMVDQNAPCDGLIISGHHTGAWGGKRAKGSLSIDFLEKLSCNPKYENWFKNIKSVWLQGCRTLGVGKIESYEESDEAFNADFHTERVGNAVAEDNLTQGIANINMEFSATLDQDNPLSTRYLRVFPRSTVFGWTRTAPGVKAQSEFSLLFHVAHMSKLNDDREPDFASLGSKMSDAAAMSYTNSILGLLNSGRSLMCEEKSVQAWLNHGQVTDPNVPGFDNPDLNAYISLSSSDDGVLKHAKQLDCKLKNAKTDKELLAALDEVLGDPKLIAVSFNGIWEMLLKLSQSDRPNDTKILEKVVLHLKSSPNLQNFLNNKIASPQLGVLRKIDYYAFIRDMNDESNVAYEAKIHEIAHNQLIKKSQNSTEQTRVDMADYKITLLTSLGKHGLLNADYLDTLKATIKDPESGVRSTTLLAAASIGTDASTIIEEGLKDKDKNVRIYGVIAAKNLGENGISILEKAAEDSDPAVSELAGLALSSDDDRFAAILRSYGLNSGGF